MSNINDRFAAARDKVVTAVSNINMNKINMDDTGYFDEDPSTEQLKQHLNGDSDREKLDAMKRLIAMTSKGMDMSSLFPTVVKNVISKNVELKKLVYMFLVHYAELEPDSALLAINSFQKDLGNSNQYIRASALRVMSSIRVKIIVQLIVLAIEKCVKDSSPYVRKTAAHAISKVYGLDPEQQEQLIGIIKVLLSDRSTMVLGSAVAAFEEICPERYDLIHPHYRKLCHLLADIDEWGQIATIGMLTRYARTQFTDPGKEKEKKTKKPKKKDKGLKFFNDDSSEGEEEDDEEEYSDEDSDDEYADLDPDHRLLLTASLPLLKSRNTGVVVAVASLYFYLAPSHEKQKVAKSLVRIVRNRREIQYVVLANIATIAAQNRSLFEPFVSEFFVDPSDPSYCRDLKLEIITLICNQDNINKILKEFRSYVTREERDFVTATIQAIGRCANQVPEVTDRCLHGLMSLITNKSDAVVAESVVVIKKLLQMLEERASKEEDQEDTMTDVILHLAGLLDTITAPKARASILWVIGEYSKQVPTLGPDILRKLAKTFASEDPSVKLQIMNLGAKLFLYNPEQTQKIFEYVLSVAKYDLNYDVRDRGRLMRKSLFESQVLRNHAERLFAKKKPVSADVNPSEGRQRFKLGSLSHILSQTTMGYIPLPDFPEEAPSGEARNEVVEAPVVTPGADLWNLDDSEGSEGSEGYDSEGWSEGSEGYDSEGSYDSEGEEESEDESEDDDDDPFFAIMPQKKPAKATKAPVKPAKATKAPAKPAAPASLDDLFDSFDTPSAAPPKPQPVADSFDELFGAPPPSSTGSALPSSGLDFMTTMEPEVKREVLLKHFVGGGLGIEYSYARVPSMHGATMIPITLALTNQSDKLISNIQIGETTLSDGMELIPFPEIEALPPGTTVDAQLSLKMSSVSQSFKFEIVHDKGTFNVTLEPSVGALVRATTMSESEFAEQEKKFKGMQEAVDTFVIEDFSSLPKRLLSTVYVSPVSLNFEEGTFQFGARSQLDDSLLVISITVDKDANKAKASVGSDNSILNNKLLKEIKKAL